MNSFLFIDGSAGETFVILLTSYVNKVLLSCRSSISIYFYSIFCYLSANTYANTRTNAANIYNYYIFLIDKKLRIVRVRLSRGLEKRKQKEKDGSIKSNRLRVETKTKTEIRTFISSEEANEFAT